MAAGRTHIRSQNAWLILMDVVCLVLGSIAGAVLRLGPEDMGPYVYDHLDGWLIFAGGIILANYLAGAYRFQHVFSRFDILVAWLFSLSLAMLVLSITSYAWFRLLLGRGVLLLAVAFYGALSLLVRMAVVKTVFRSELFQCRTAIMGMGERARHAKRIVESSLVLPAHKVVVYLGLIRGGKRDEDIAAFNVIDGVGVLKTDQTAIVDIVRSLNVDLIIAAPDDLSETAQFYPQLRRLRFDGVEVLSYASVVEIYNGRIPLDMLTEESLMQMTWESNMPLVSEFKRMLDIVISLLVGIVLLPVGLIVALLIKISAPQSSVLYSQLRVGHFGKVFRIYKFRTMRENAEDETGPVWASVNDPRITRLGKVLRRFRLDEIPQLVNVIAGDMSLVGPRPERPEICEGLSRKIPYFSERQNVMPGISGWAQIKYPYGDSIEDARRKLEYDLYYIKHLTLRMDLEIILRTLRIVLFGKERNV